METKNYVMSFKPNQIWFSPGDTSGLSDARQYFWEEYQYVILEELQKEINDGWRAITIVGPAGFILREYEREEVVPPNINAYMVAAMIVTFGLAFFIYLIMGDLTPKKYYRTVYEPTEFRVAMQR